MTAEKRYREERRGDTVIREDLPIAWKGRIHVQYLTVHGQKRVRGCESRTDAISFCQGIDAIDRALTTFVTRNWVMVACRCDSASATTTPPTAVTAMGRTRGRPDQARPPARYSA